MELTDADRIRISEIEARLLAATPGPWEWRYDTELVNPNLYREFQISVNDGPGYWEKMNNATVLAVVGTGTSDLEISAADRQFIANTREDIAWLIEKLRSKD